MSAPMVFSIKAPFVALIMEGSKRFEIRRSTPRIHWGEDGLIYESRGRGRIVARFTVGLVYHNATGEGLHHTIELAGGGAGIERDALLKYLKGAKRPTAIKLLDVKPLDLPLPKGMSPPQSWARYKGTWPL